MPKPTVAKRGVYGDGSVYPECDVRYGCPPVEDGPPHPRTGKPTRVRPPHRNCKAPWVGSFTHGFTERGNPRRHKVKAATESKARARMRARMVQVIDSGGASASAKTTVKQWADDWLEIVVQTLRPQSYTSACSSVRKWIVPAIGQKRLTDLAPADVRKVMNKMREAGLKPSSRRRTHSVLIQLLKAARADGHAVPAIVLEVPAPPLNKPARTDLPLDLAVEMLVVAAEQPNASRWVAALMQGIRQGESLGLCWSEIDFDRHILVISQQLKPLPYNVRFDRDSGFRVPDNYDAKQLEGRWHLVRPKTEESYRIQPLLPWFEKALLKWRDEAPDSPHGLVWPAADGGPRDPKDDDQAWYDLQDEVGRRRGKDVLYYDDPDFPEGRHYTIHEARHTTATLLLEAGVEPAVIIAILGHASMLSTKAYLHVKTGPLAAALEKVAKRLELAA
ncbi:tyrosine-type recombinase/integrase [Nocardioides sp. SLBN-35]|uniref:tyrosine-type recombinase/integrase n=1 Tax=Nocardioides sp. SLBN-35 TaxID=2768445 RepID=UPI001152DAAC|nr:tyrosine-type recombinase/integrase [Nocardioides sp. SLBN-35]TQK68275.1 site-specific recombinase XerD [Nocardioides sp. SLBN-35]